MCNAVYMYFKDSTVMPIITNYDDLKATIRLVKETESFQDERFEKKMRCCSY